LVIEVEGRTGIESVDGDTGFWTDGEALLSCLREAPPRVPAHFGYDALGSKLFEEITELPSYYLTRVEDSLLQSHAEELADELATPWIVELGSGSGKKTRVLLAACAARRRTTFLPIDVSREMLVSSSDALTADCGDVSVRGLWGRYESGLRWVRGERSAPLTMMWLGSTLGNTTPTERRALLAEITRTLAPGDRFLVSADLIKPAQIFERCYNDPPGHAAFVRFRLNHLAHLNRRFAGDFVLDRFQARAHYNKHTRMVEGHLYATTGHVAELHALGAQLEFRVGDSINVGFSAKFDPARFIDEMRQFDLFPHKCWLDRRWQYGLFLFRRR
jgi:L-histidine N-alpha-methyltransferase